MVEKSTDYALVMDGAVCHVGLKLEGAAPAALSFSDLTKGYDHPVPSDLSRVKRHEKAADTAAAINWVIRYAVSLLNGGLTVDGDMVSFAPGKGFDDLKWRKGKVTRPGPNIYAQLRDPFDPMSGLFSENIRINEGDLTELRESMKAWGWIDQPQFRALGDRRTKVVLIGHRRIAVAKELGIDWGKHVDWIELGEGDAADAERFRLAIASNIGAKALSSNDRKRLAAHLYSEQEWSQDKIAKALTVDQKTISRDLDELGIMPKSKRGRPRKEEAKTIVAKAAERRGVTPEQEGQIAALTEEGLTRDAIAARVGVGAMGVRTAQQRHLGRLEERERIAREVEADEHACTCPTCGQKHLRKS